jgi:putative ABC transport system substrate-binding protein
LQRRRFIAGLLALVTFRPFSAKGQPAAHVRRLGVLLQVPENSPEGLRRITAFRRAFKVLGWDEGRNVQIEYRWTGGIRELADAYASELVGANPEVLLAGNAEVTLALQRASRTIPIVFAEIIDPVSNGLVAGLAKPGGNITGFMMLETAIAGKWLELLQALKPDVRRVALMYDPGVPASNGFLAVIEQVDSKSGLRISSTPVRSGADIEQFFESTRDNAALGAIQLPGSIMALHRKFIVRLAAEYRLPMIYGLRDNTEKGGLASYGVDSVHLYEQAASYVDRILKGENPADLPVQAATRYELVINLKAAKALGLEVSPELITRADELIE